MVSNEKRWKSLFLFTIGLAIGTAFCLKWMEADLIVNGDKFTILGLELFYDKTKMESILTGIDDRVQTVLSYHLYFDFAFMAGIFPSIAAMCMMVSYRTSNPVGKKVLYLLAALQILAWAFDIIENIHLLKWIGSPVITQGGLTLFHIIVSLKWIISLTGVIVVVVFFFLKKKTWRAT